MVGEVGGGVHRGCCVIMSDMMCLNLFHNTRYFTGVMMRSLRCDMHRVDKLTLSTNLSDGLS